MTVYLRQDGSISNTESDIYDPLSAPVITSVIEFDSDTLRIAGTDPNGAVSPTGYGYELQRKIDDGPFETVFRTVQVIQPAFSFDDDFATDVPRNRTYTYRIKAFNAFEDSPFSNEDSINLATNLLTVVLDPLSRLDRTISLSWTNGGGTAGDIIEIYKSVGGSGFGLLTTLSNTALAYDDVFGFLQLEATTYDYRIRHVKPTDNGDFSNTEQIIVGFDLSAIVLDTPVFSATNTVDLTWTDPNLPAAESGIDIERATGINGVFSKITEGTPGDLAHSDTSGPFGGTFRPGETYKYRLRPFNAAQPGPNSNTEQVTKDLLVPEIQTLMQTGDTGVRITWITGNSLHTETEIERDDGGGFSLVGTVPNGTLTFDDEFSSATGSVHDYRVRDKNTETTGAYSDTRSIELTNTLSALTSVNPFFVNENLIRLNWTNINGSQRETIIERKDEGGTYSTIATVNKGITTYDDAFATLPGEVYVYRLHDENNQEIGPDSEEAAIIAPLLVPSNFRVSSIVSTTVTLEWDDDNTREDGYIIERAIGLTGTFSEIGRVGVDITTFVNVVPNAPGQVFLYRAITFRSSTELGEQVSSISAQATTAVPLNAPTAADVVRPDGVTFEIVWTDVTNSEQSGYRIFKKVGAGSFQFLTELVDPDIRLYNDLGTITAGTLYEYRVVAFNAFTQSVASNTASITPRFNAPITVGVQISRTAAEITITMPAGYVPVGGDLVRVTRSVNGGLESQIASIASALPDVTVPDATLGALTVGDRLSYSAQLVEVGVEAGPFSGANTVVVREVISLPDSPISLFGFPVVPSDEASLPAISDGRIASFYLTGAGGTTASVVETPSLSVDTGVTAGRLIVSMENGTGDIMVGDASGVLHRLDTSLNPVSTLDLNSPAQSALGGWTAGTFGFQGNMSAYGDLVMVIGTGAGAGIRILLIDTDSLNFTIIHSIVVNDLLFRRGVVFSEGIAVPTLNDTLRIYSIVTGAVVREVAIPGLISGSRYELTKFETAEISERVLAYLTSRQLAIINFNTGPETINVITIPDVGNAGNTDARFVARTSLGNDFTAVATIDNRVLLYKGTILTQTVVLEGPSSSIHGISFQEVPGLAGQVTLHVAKSTGQVVRLIKPFTSNQFVSAT